MSSLLTVQDVLSAVDAHTAQHLYQHVLCGEIVRHRTVVMVTHAVELCLPAAARVAVLDQGRVVSFDSPAALSVASLVSAIKSPEPPRPQSARLDSVLPADLGKAAATATPRDIPSIRAPARPCRSDVAGYSTLELWTGYAKAFGSWTVCLITLALFFVSQVAQIASQLYLRDWAASDADPYSDAARQFAWIYTAICVASVVFEITRMSLFVRNAG